MSTINLLPEDYLQRRGQRRGNFICLMLLGVVMGSICGAALVSERSSRRTREVCERINAAYADAARLIDEVHQLEEQKRTMIQKAKMSAALMERLPRSCVLAMLTNALPRGASLQSVQMSVRTIHSVGPVLKPGSPGKPLTKHALVSANRQGKEESAPDLAVQLEIKGKASTDVQVARFIANLARHCLTESVDLSYSKEADSRKETSTREFQLTVQLRPNADALDAIKEASEEAKQAAHANDRAAAGDGA